MKIHPVANNYYQNSAKFLTQKVSFGENKENRHIWTTSKIKLSKEEYQIRKDVINTKYNNMKEYWIGFYDDLKMDRIELAEKLTNIEKQRRREMTAFEESHCV